MTAVDERRKGLIVAAAFALCLIAGSPARIVGDGGEYLAQALNFAAFNPPSLGRQSIPVIQQRIVELEPALSHWDIENASIAGPDRRRDFLHFWIYALLATPFVWITATVGVSPLHAFTALNLGLLGLALYLAIPRIGPWVTVLLFASPLVWWLDKAHTEIFTVALLSIAIVSMEDRPWWALVAAGMAATQNPPITIVVVLILAVELWRRRLAILSDRRMLAGAAAGLALSGLQPAYTYARHGTPSLLLYATQPGFPTPAELAASVLDPSMGLAGNFPMFLIATGAALAWLALRHPRALITPTALVCAGATATFLYSFAQTSNPHHGGTPSLTRYALWFIPLSLAVWMPLRVFPRVGVGRLVAAAAGLSAAISVFAFHPAVAQNSREPTWLAAWLWTQHPAWNNPLPEVFAETLRHREGVGVPTATDGCQKILIRGDGLATGGVWPFPCLPAEVPDRCRAPGSLCYANRRGDVYDFARAPGRAVFAQPFDAETWPRQAEDTVRRIYLEADWAAKIDAPAAPLNVLRAQQDVRVTSFGTDEDLLLVARPIGPDPVLRFRPLMPMRGTITDASTAEPLRSLRFDGAPRDLWEVALPASPAGLLLVTLTRGDTAE